MDWFSHRRKLLTNHVKRLDRRIAYLEDINRRFFWRRLLSFMFGGALVWAAFVFLGETFGWGTLVIAGTFFLGVVSAHSLHTRRLDVFRRWRDLYTRQLARLQLDWTHLPLPAWMPGDNRSPLETDLDLTGPQSLHHLLDVSLSVQGSYRLAEWLRVGEPDLPEIQRRQLIVAELARQRRFRGRLLLAYGRYQQAPLDGEKLVDWLKSPFSADRLRWVLPVAGILSLVNIGLFLLAIFADFPDFWLLTFVIYYAFYYFNSSYLGEFLEAVTRLDSELSKVRTLLFFVERYPLHNAPHTTAFCAPLRTTQPRPSILVRRIQWITGGVGLRMNPVVGLVLNAVLPWDALFARLAAGVRSQVAGLLPAWLETLYQLEALCGLANHLELNPQFVIPQIASERAPVFAALRLGHPLLPPEQKVRNDFQMDNLGQVMLITGSNMAGKSTFLKTVGINVCLAYAGGAVDAAAFQIAPVRMHTCMRISDSIADGFSYFYAEVRCLRMLLDKIRLPEAPPLLYLVDEIFRGTNNRERLAGSRAYLQALIQANGIGFLATHDLELASLAEQTAWVQNFHFREEVFDNRLVFDYLIRPGPCPTTNALKIMQMEGLPIEIAEKNE
jgi:hypothetical protein